MFGAVIHAAHDVRFEEREDPRLLEPTDAVIRTLASCVCGSDLWRYRGLSPVEEPTPIGHEYLGVVEEVGTEVTGVSVGDVVVGGFTASDNTCPLCRRGMTASCRHRSGYDGCQAERIRVPLADGTLLTVPGASAADGGEAALPADLVPSLLALSDVMCTGWHGAVCAGAAPGTTVAVVGDGAVGLCAVIAARQMGAERVIAMSRHEDRAALAREFGADEVVAERGEEGIARIKELTGGYGAHGVVEAVGNQTSMDQAIGACRPGGKVGFVGVAHDVALDGLRMFFAQVALEGGPAPVREYLPHLIELIWNGEVNPGKVFTRQLPLEEAAEAYAAMDERRDIKVMLRP